MTSKQKIVSDDIYTIINKSNNILLHLHPYPDPDSVGSALSMALWLQYLGKKVRVIAGDTGYPEYLKSLPDINLIENIEYSKVDIDNIDLFIILDSSSLTQITQKNNISFPKKLKTIVIDHHKTNLNYGLINLVDGTASSTCEILFNLFKYWKVKISVNQALYLLLGIYADTGGFQYLNSTPKTVRSFYALTKIQPNYHKYLFEIENHKRPIELEMMGLALSNIQRYYSDRVAISVVENIELAKRRISKEDAMEGLVGSLLRSVSNWKIVASLVESEPDKVTVSLRTRDEINFDVSMIAKTIGKNGGGHRGAAGTTICASMKESISLIIATIGDLYPELRK